MTAPGTRLLRKSMAKAGALNQAPAIRSSFRIARTNLDRHRDFSVPEMNINTIVDATNDEMVNESEFGIQKGLRVINRR